MADTTRIQVPCDRCESAGEIIESSTGDLVSCPDCNGSGWVTVEETITEPLPDIETIEGYILREIVPLFQDKETGTAYAYVQGTLYALQDKVMNEVITRLVASSVNFDKQMMRGGTPNSVAAQTSLRTFQKAVADYENAARQRRPISGEAGNPGNGSRGEIRQA